MAETSAEALSEQISRLEQMAEDGEGEIWDLSANDQAAIKAVLAEVRRLRAHQETLEHCQYALSTLVSYLRSDERWPVKSEHMAYLASAENALRVALSAGSLEPERII